MSDPLVDARASTGKRAFAGRRGRGPPRPPQPHVRRRKRGKPPPPLFDFDKLADSTLLDTEEVAAVLRRAIETVAKWRNDPTHPLQYERMDNDRPMYRVAAIRAYMRRK
jgi:hypothetical protein